MSPGSVSPQLLGTVDIIIYLLAVAKAFFSSRGWYGKDFFSPFHQRPVLFLCLWKKCKMWIQEKKIVRSKEMSVQKFELLNIDCRGTASKAILLPMCLPIGTHWWVATNLDKSYVKSTLRGGIQRELNHAVRKCKQLQWLHTAIIYIKLKCLLRSLQRSHMSFHNNRCKTLKETRNPDLA